MTKSQHTNRDTSATIARSMRETPDSPKTADIRTCACTYAKTAWGMNHVGHGGQTCVCIRTPEKCNNAKALPTILRSNVLQTQHKACSGDATARTHRDGRCPDHNTMPCMQSACTVTSTAKQCAPTQGGQGGTRIGTQARRSTDRCARPQIPQTHWVVRSTLTPGKCPRVRSRFFLEKRQS